MIVAASDLVPLLAISDDLSGAAETAAAIALGANTEILLTADATSAAPVVALDLDTRHRDPADAAAAIRATLPAWRERTIVKKVDSMLRGNLAAEIGALRTDRTPVVVATALPAFERTVRRGVVHLAGEPLHRTSAWAAEAAAPPTSIAAALALSDAAVVELATVRSADLPAVLAAHVVAGRVPICDGETDTDLDAVVAAALAIPGCRLVGSGGLAAALGRRLYPGTAADQPAASGTSVLVVVGTAAPIAVDQIRCLADSGARHIPLPAKGLRDHDVVSRIAASLDSGVTVVSLDPPGALDPAHARRTACSLAEAVVAATAERSVDLVLTGGDTARCVLDAAGINRLTPVRSIHHGAVACRTVDGRSIVVRPGSFGGTDSLLRITEALTNSKKGACAH